MLSIAALSPEHWQFGRKTDTNIAPMAAESLFWGVSDTIQTKRRKVDHEPAYSALWVHLQFCLPVKYYICARTRGLGGAHGRDSNFCLGKGPAVVYAILSLENLRAEIAEILRLVLRRGASGYGPVSRSRWRVTFLLLGCAWEIWE
jgi:hypothetical protein